VYQAQQLSASSEAKCKAGFKPQNKCVWDNPAGSHDTTTAALAAEWIGNSRQLASHVPQGKHQEKRPHGGLDPRRRLQRRWSSVPVIVALSATVWDMAALLSRHLALRVSRGSVAHHVAGGMVDCTRSGARPGLNPPGWQRKPESRLHHRLATSIRAPWPACRPGNSAGDGPTVIKYGQIGSEAVAPLRRPRSLKPRARLGRSC